MRQPIAFIFDIDGTMVNSMETHAKAWLELFKQIGMEYEEQDLRRLIVGRTTDDILRQAFGGNISAIELNRLSQLKETIFRQLYSPHLTPIPGLLNFLEKSRLLGIPMAVASSASRENIDFTLSGLGVTSFFNAVLGDETGCRSKPYPDIYLAAARRLGMRAQDCLVFEDSAVGIQAALQAGMKVVAIATSLTPQEIRQRFPVARVIRDFNEIDPTSAAALITSDQS